LLRDGAAGLEVLMLERHKDAFFSGALVFPGGRVEESDGAPGDALSYRIAALRETYEEAGILLARPRGGSDILSAAALAALEARHPADLLASGETEFATDRLVPYAHWVTPERSPKRYDTQFFLAATPPDQEPRADGYEAVDIAWIAPKVACAEADAGRRQLVFATRCNLVRLARHDTVSSALAEAAASVARIACICPEVYDVPAGRRIRIPPGLGYELCDMPMPARALG
jgi:8-oxo-dGTP pyrophosphatase MutT (NUDIX family)